MKIELTDAERWTLLKLLHMELAAIYEHAKWAEQIEHPRSRIYALNLLAKLSSKDDK